MVVVFHSEGKILRTSSSNPNPSKKKTSFSKCLLVHISISEIKDLNRHDQFQKGAGRVHSVKDKVH